MGVSSPCAVRGFKSMAQVRHPVGESGWLKTGHRTQMPEEVLWRPQGKFALFSVKGRPILGGAMLLPAGD